MSAQPYSGTNPIPKISDFLREETPEDKTGAVRGRASVRGNRRTVTDPTTGNEVTIEDANREFMREAQKDNVVVPNANLPDRKGSGGEVRPLLLVMASSGRWLNPPGNPILADSVPRGVRQNTGCDGPPGSGSTRFDYRCPHPRRKDKHPLPPYSGAIAAGDRLSQL